ncbi:MAG: hypothetical protein P8J89_08080 [Phycisphaerales bacterium]|nr:hypothetical protein [Phycisphaerales bacterium]
MIVARGDVATEACCLEQTLFSFDSNEIQCHGGDEVMDGLINVDDILSMIGSWGYIQERHQWRWSHGSGRSADSA